MPKCQCRRKKVLEGCHQGEVVEQLKVSVEHESGVAAIGSADAVELPLWACVGRTHILWLIKEVDLIVILLYTFY
jgi:hypothetical protein